MGVCCVQRASTHNLRGRRLDTNNKLDVSCMWSKGTRTFESLTIHNSFRKTAARCPDTRRLNKHVLHKTSHNGVLTVNLNSSYRGGRVQRTMSKVGKKEHDGDATSDGGCDSTAFNQHLRMVACDIYPSYMTAP
jgi:hypothetical protein